VDENSKLTEILKRISQLNREIHRHKMKIEETGEGWKLAA